MELGILHVSGDKIELYTFYNHRICKKINRIDIKYKKSFEYCQANIHGIQTPNYESVKQVDRRRIHDKIIKQIPPLDKQVIYNDLSCYKLRKILQELFMSEFKNVVNFKGGNFETEYLRNFVYSNVNIVDLGNFDIKKYIDIVSKYDLYNIKRHSMLHKFHTDWIRHCPQYEVLSFYEYFKIHL